MVPWLLFNRTSESPETLEANIPVPFVRPTSLTLEGVLRKVVHVTPKESGRDYWLIDIEADKALVEGIPFYGTVHAEVDHRVRCIQHGNFDRGDTEVSQRLLDLNEPRLVSTGYAESGSASVAV